MFHQVKTVTPLAGWLLDVEFHNGAKKRYDVNPLFVQWAPFRRLKNGPALLAQVRVDL
jgi:hypothetical protein